jgi:hypothetical protein
MHAVHPNIAVPQQADTPVQQPGGFLDKAIHLGFGEIDPFAGADLEVYTRDNSPWKSTRAGRVDLAGGRVEERRLPSKGVPAMLPAGTNAQEGPCVGRRF